MTAKQKRFCEEYRVDLNATQAAIRAGYSEKSAYSIGQRLLKNVEAQNYIELLLAELREKSAANEREVVEYLTSVMRGQASSEVIVIEGTGDGRSQARRVDKNPDEKEKLKAAELLGKHLGIFTDRLDLNAPLKIEITNDYGDGNDS